MLLASCYFCLDIMLRDKLAVELEWCLGSAQSVMMAGEGFSFHTQEVVPEHPGARSMDC